MTRACWDIACPCFQQIKTKIVGAVEVAVGDGFHDVGLADLDAGVEVSDGAGNF